MARALLLAVVALLTLTSPAVAQQKGRKVAFLVGVGDFKHDPPNLNGSPQKDVTALAGVLRDGGFEVVLMTDRDATRAQIEKRFKDTLMGNGDPAKSLGKGDLILVHICTHGFTLPPAPNKPDAPFLAAHDSMLDRPETMVALNGLIDGTRASGATALYMIDACRDFRDRDRASRGVEGTQVQLSKGTAILFSCGRGQVSHQSAQADGHGLFTFAVLKVLRGQAGLKDRVSWTGLVFEVENTFQSTDFKKMIPVGKPQTPFAAAGELEFTEVLTIGGAIAPDVRAYLDAQARGDVAAHLKAVAADRLPAWRAHAESGHPAAQFLLAKCLHEGVGTAKDESEAVRWYQKAADGGNPLAMVNLGFMYKSGSGGLATNPVKAVELYTKAAAANQPQGLRNLGEMHEQGAGGLAKDLEKAADLYQRATDAGHLTSNRDLGRVLVLLGDQHDDGIGRPQNSAKAFELYRRAALAGDRDGMNSVGYLYEKGRGTARDEAAAFGWYRKAADAGSTVAMANLGVMYRQGRGVTRDYVRSLEWSRKAADAGNTSGMVGVGWMHENGHGTERDYAKALEWYLKAANAGNVLGMTNAGGIYEGGRGVPKDDAKAVEWYQKAANAKHPRGMTNLGVMYRNGRGVAQSDAKALEWYQKAADLGDAQGMNNVGWMHENGYGTAKDESKAFDWYRRSAEAGNLDGMVNVGVLYRQGRGTAKDEYKAVDWYKKAADAGDAGGMTNLAFMYLNGHGTAKDETRAFELYRKAADIGDVQGTAYLGWCYETGTGTGKDMVRAVELYRKAADKDNKYAKDALKRLQKD